MTTTTATVNEAVGINDVFVWTWGYDQTNVDFYLVVDVSKTGKTAKVVPIESTYVELGGAAGNKVVPTSPPVVKTKTVFGEWVENPDGTWRNPEVLGTEEVPVKSKRIGHTADGHAYLSKEYGWCKLWGGDSVYETAAGFGH